MCVLRGGANRNIKITNFISLLSSGDVNKSSNTVQEFSALFQHAGISTVDFSYRYSPICMNARVLSSKRKRYLKMILDE